MYTRETLYFGPGEAVAIDPETGELVDVAISDLALISVPASAGVVHWATDNRSAIKEGKSRTPRKEGQLASLIRRRKAAKSARIARRLNRK